MARIHVLLIAAISAGASLVPVVVLAQVNGKSTGQCNYNDGRGWVQCGDYPAGASGGSTPSGPSSEQLMQQQMLDSAGQLGAALGTAIGRQLSGEADREEAQGFNNQAIEAANRGDWRAARSLTLQALKLAPDDSILKSNLAFCDRQIAEAEQREAALRRDQERARQEAEAAAAARRREEIAQNLQGQLKLGGGGGSNSESPLGLKLGEPDPVVASANSNSLGFKLGDEERAGLKDAPRDRRSKAPRVQPPWALGPRKKGDDNLWHVQFTNESGVTYQAKACVRRPEGSFNRLQLPGPLKPGESEDFKFDAGDLLRVTTDGSDPCAKGG